MHLFLQHLLLVVRLLIVGGGLSWLALPGRAVDPPPGASASGPAAATADSAKAKESPAPDNYKQPLKPLTVHAGRDYEIGRLVGQLLEENHYLHVPVSGEISQRWLKIYLRELDPNRQFFLAGDIDEFTTRYGSRIGSLLLRGNDEEEATAPAFTIFTRFMQRLQNRIQFAESILRDSYTFTGPDVFTTQTDKRPWLADQAAADTFWRSRVKSDLLSGLLDKKAPEETIKRLAKRYATVFRDFTELEEGDVLSLYITSLCKAYDPHTEYFGPQDAENFLLLSIKPSVTGIGAVLREDDGYATIEEVIAGGPADLDKRLQPGDRIIAVGDGDREPVDVVNIKLNRVVELIRGKKGTMVHLVVLPAGSSDTSVHKDIRIKRDTVSIKESLAKADIIDHITPAGVHQKIGVIDLKTFYTNASKDIAKLIQRLKKEEVGGIIFDMRNNGGGLLDQAVDITGLFIERNQPVVQVGMSNHPIEQLRTQNSHPIYNGPLLVMVNKASASATEIVAGALQDYGRALVVGDQSTHGKGTVQTFISLQQSAPIGFEGDPGDLKLTVQKFYRVAGGSTQQRGVVPDIVLPSLLDALELGETTLPYYLPYDEVPRADYSSLGLTEPYLPTLQSLSKARVAGSRDFGYVRQDIDYYKAKIKEGTLSLNLEVRTKEKQALLASNNARKKDLADRKASRDVELELTLDTVDKGGPAIPHKEKKRRTRDDENKDEDGALLNNDAALTDDPAMDESVNILSDYTRLLTRSGSSLVQATGK